MGTTLTDKVAFVTEILDTLDYWQTCTDIEDTGIAEGDTLDGKREPTPASVLHLRALIGVVTHAVDLCVEVAKCISGLRKAVPCLRSSTSPCQSSSDE
ncbi:MAG: hypothetical protein [Circoviridae sp.]|nr:MAG: hypothetical protein [Circoviridae sp.]